MKDFRGTTICVGDTIVYPCRRGSSLWMQEGEVTGFGTGAPGSWKAGAPTLKVLAMVRDWTTRSGFQIKNVTLTALGRVTVVPPRPQY